MNFREAQMQSLVNISPGLKWLYGILLVFAILASVAVTKEFFWIFLIPPLLIIVVTGIFRMDILMLFTVAITPLSINLANTELGIGVSLPSEPIIFGLMLLFLFKLLYENRFDKKILYHPVSLAIIFHLVWMFITSLTSSMLLVSVKSSLARFCFVMVFFYFCTQVFKDIRKIKVFAWCYLIPLIIVIGYTTYMHSLSGFTGKAAHTAMVPFYNDHTAYAAVIAMFIPLTFAFIGELKPNNAHKIITVIALIILIIAIVLSYTRASWLSLVAAFVCYLIFLFRIKTYVVISGIAAVIAIFILFQTTITMELERNDEESSTDYAAHVGSMSNISTDASNVERLNRWACAFRMFHERPLFGWGPGTYMFQYAPFQKWSERTIISTNFGEGGNAHSEYIGPLAEQGVIGPLAFIVIGIIVIVRTSRLIINSTDVNVRILAKGLVLGLITYWVHGMLNNFLDTEKASVPFWAFIAALVALEVYHHPKKTTELSGKADA